METLSPEVVRFEHSGTPFEVWLDRVRDAFGRFLEISLVAVQPSMHEPLPSKSGILPVPHRHARVS
jgi:hypothetical protein